MQMMPYLPLAVPAHTTLRDVAVRPDGRDPKELHRGGEERAQTCSFPARWRCGGAELLYGPGRHLGIDAVISTVYRNTILSATSLISGHVAKLAEDRKFKADEVSSQPVSCKHGGDHVLVPFAAINVRGWSMVPWWHGGTLGAHAHALLKTLAEHAVSAGRYISPDSRSPLSPPMQVVSLWMQRGQNRLSTWLHVSLSQQILHLYRPVSALVSSLLDP